MLKTSPQLRSNRDTGTIKYEDLFGDVKKQHFATRLHQIVIDIISDMYVVQLVQPSILCYVLAAKAGPKHPLCVAVLVHYLGINIYMGQKLQDGKKCSVCH